MPLFQLENFVALYEHQKTATPSTTSRILSSLNGHVNVASSNLTAWSSNLLHQLPASIRDLVASHEGRTAGTVDRFSSLNSTAAASTLTALVLGLLYLAAKFLMSTYYRGSTDGWSGGRRSPYTSGMPIDVLDHVEYLTSDSIDARRAPQQRPSTARSYEAPPVDPEDAPDCVILKSRGQEHKLHFVPFAISDGLLLVGDLRKYAAEKLNADPKRVRLLYKRQPLEDDSRPATYYGVKQNSTVSCVLTEGSNSTIDSSSDDNLSGASSNVRPGGRQLRPRGQSNVRHRSQEQLPVRSDFLHPANAGISRPTERLSRKDSVRTTTTNGDSRRHASHSRGPSPNPSTTTSSTSTSSAPIFEFKPPKFPPKFDETGPFGKLKTLSDAFYNTWLPLCDRYIRHPPSDPKEREKECKRLTESILAHITLKLDVVDVNGNNEARTIRKGLVERANEVMRRCDERNWEVNPKKER